MFPAHDVSGLHPLSCLSLSQREAITSPGQVQRLLDKGDGRGNQTRTSSHPHCHRDSRRSPLDPLNLSNSSLFPSTSRQPWCARFFTSRLSQGLNSSSQISPSVRTAAISKLPQR